MRIAIGGIHHETNCFASDSTPLSVFEQRQSQGQQIIKEYKGIRTYLGGFIDELEARNAQIIGGYNAAATPSGIIEKEAAEIMASRIVETMWQAHLEQPLDGIALSLHGAGAAQEHPDLEGCILRQVRQRFGMDIPVGVVMDLHGNVTEEMIRLCDVPVGVKCYPHVDQYESARIMAGILCGAVSSGVKPFKKLIRLPWLTVPAAGVTLSGPAAKIRQYCLELEQAPEVLQASFFHGFPYGDTIACGVSVVAVGTTQEAADSAALKLARYAWGLRHEFVPQVLGAEEAVEEALRHDGLSVIGESSDNTGGGAPGDGTYLLKAMLDRNAPGSVFMGIYDPQVVETARKAGAGNRISCLLGGKTDSLHGAPVELKEAQVVSFCDGCYVCRSPMGQGSWVDLGDSVRLQAGNVTVIVVSKRAQPKDDGLLEIMGLDYRQLRLVALKSSQHFKAWWMEHCDTIVVSDPPGIHSSDLSCFNFKHANTDCYPLKDIQWDE